MAEQAHESVVVEVAGQAVLAALEWREIPPGKRGVRTEARKIVQQHKQDGVLTLISKDGQRGVYAVIPSGSKKVKIAGAAWFARSFADVGHSVAFFHPLEGDYWWLIGVSNGLVIPGMDVVGRWDECMEVYDTMRQLGIQQHVIVPPEEQSHFDEASYMSAEEALRGVEKPTVSGKSISPVMLLGGGIILLALLGGGGYWVYENFIYEPPPPPPKPVKTGPSQQEIDAHNQKVRDEAIKNLLDGIARTPRPTDVLATCLGEVDRAGWTPPGWKVQSILCAANGQPNIEYARERYGRLADLAEYLSVTPGEKGNGFNAMPGSRTVRYVPPLKSSPATREPTNRPPDMAHYVRAVFPPLEPLYDATGGQVGINIGDPKVVEAKYTGWNNRGKDVPMSAPAYLEGTLAAEGENLERLRYVMTKADHPSIRVKSVTITPGERLQWKMETQYAVKLP